MTGSPVATVAAVEVTLASRRRLVAGVAVVGSVVAAIVAPGQQGRRHLDHIAFLDVLREMRGGAGYYDAFIVGMGSIGARIDELRAFREPLSFWAWSALPEDWLQPGFFLVVVLGSSLLAASASRVPELGLAVGAYLATAGVFNGVDAWLISELWAVPFVLLACSAWLRRMDWLAAGAATVAILIRETAVLLPIGFLLGSRSAGRRPAPWVVCLAAGSVGLGLHWLAASGHLIEDGSSATLGGTGGLSAVAWMTSFLVMPDLLGLVLWVAGCVALWRSPLRPAIAQALIPLSGLLVNRPYWGFLAMPLCIVSLGGFDEPTARGELTQGGAPSDGWLRRRRRAATTAP